MAFDRATKDTSSSQHLDEWPQSLSLRSRQHIVLALHQRVAVGGLPWNEYGATAFAAFDRATKDSTSSRHRDEWPPYLHPSSWQRIVIALHRLDSNLTSPCRFCTASPLVLGNPPLSNATQRPVPMHPSIRQRATTSSRIPSGSCPFTYS